MVIDHIGIAVRSLEDGIRKWESLFGYRKSSDVVVNTRQKVRVVFLSKQGSLLVKLFEPLDATSPTYLFARKGGGLHHVCFRCDDLTSQIKLLEGKGALLIAPPQPGEAFENHNIAFVLADHVNVELIDTDAKAGMVDQ